MSKVSEWMSVQFRDNGESFYVVAAAAPAWFGEAVHAAHEGELPNDWRYAMCANIVSLIGDGVMESGKIADEAVDTYTVALGAWLAGDLERASDVDEWIADRSPWCAADGGIWSVIRGGQYLCIDRMACVILQAFEDAYQSDEASTDGLELDEWIAQGCPMVLDAYNGQLAEVAAEVES